MTLADLEAMAAKLKDAKRECSAQLRAIEADLCSVLIAIDNARTMQTTRSH